MENKDIIVETIVNEEILDIEKSWIGISAEEEETVEEVE